MIISDYLLAAYSFLLLLEAFGDRDKIFAPRSFVLHIDISMVLLLAFVRVE